MEIQQNWRHCFSIFIYSRLPMQLPNDWTHVDCASNAHKFSQRTAVNVNFYVIYNCCRFQYCFAITYSQFWQLSRTFCTCGRKYCIDFVLTKVLAIYTCTCTRGDQCRLCDWSCAFNYDDYYFGNLLKFI